MIDSNPIIYVGIIFFVFIIFWILFNLFDELLYFSPIIYFYIPPDALTGFIFATISAFLLGLLVALNIFLFKYSRVKLDRKFVSGSFLALLSSMCASCSSIGFLIISIFGTAGMIATTLLSNYQTHLRILSVLVLIWAVYAICGRIAKGCSVNEEKSATNKCGH